MRSSCWRAELIKSSSQESRRPDRFLPLFLGARSEANSMRSRHRRTPQSLQQHCRYHWRIFREVTAPKRHAQARCATVVAESVLLMRSLVLAPSCSPAECLQAVQRLAVGPNRQPDLKEPPVHHHGQGNTTCSLLVSSAIIMNNGANDHVRTRRTPPGEYIAITWSCVETTANRARNDARRPFAQ